MIATGNHDDINSLRGAPPHRSLSTIDRRVFAEIFSHVNNGSAYSSIGCGRGMPRPYNGVSFKQQFVVLLTEPYKHLIKQCDTGAVSEIIFCYRHFFRLYFHIFSVQCKSNVLIGGVPQRDNERAIISLKFTRADADGK